MMISKLTRREFLKGSGAAALALSLGQLRFALPDALGAEGGPWAEYPYQSWEDLYRQRWKWDRVVKGSHNLNCGPQAGCNWDIFVKDGMVWREEQVGNYPQTNPTVPDFNPRGCQKGACFSHRMYDPGRVKYPLRRVGERGEGKWQRVSWEEALTEIADTLIDVLSTEGPDTIVFDTGTNFSFGAQGIGLFRTIALLDVPVLTMDAEIGDHFPGVAMTLGKMSMHSSGDDSFYSDLILIWGGNPIYTQIPNAHFFLEARYHRAKLIVITPDYNPSAIHADLWIPINIGTDAALGLALAQVIIEEKLYDENFIQEQTDLPLLVREDTKRFLRGSDVQEGGEGEVFYAFNLADEGIKEMPVRSLGLDGTRPALAGEYEVETLQGKVKVRPVFELLKERLTAYTPEKASQITGVQPQTIRALARDIAQARAASIVSQQNSSKFYHGDLMDRARLLVLALCGQLGKKGSGFNSFCLWNPDGARVAPVVPTRPSVVEAVNEWEKGIEPVIQGLREKGYTDEMIAYELEREAAGKAFVSGTLFYYLHGGIHELSSGQSRAWDPYLKKGAKEYVEEALARGWQFVEPPPGKDPRILISEGGNILRRVRGYPKLIERLLPKLKLLVHVDWRLSNTGRYADFLLPCAGWYEKDDTRWAIAIPNVHVTTRAVDPLGESKPEWEIHCLLARKIQERARQRGKPTFQDRSGKERRLDTLYEELTFERAYTEKPTDIEKLIDDVLQVSKNLEGVTWKDLKERGHARVTGLGRAVAAVSEATDIKPQETVTPLTWHREKKVPWPTLTRRIQFYIDHELFLELGEELPIHKDSIKAGGDYALQMTGGHTRWSIHSSWRDDAYMLRLQRGAPVMYMSAIDAKARGIEDGEEVEVRNDLGSFRIQAKVSSSVRPGQVIVYHAWEPYQFRGGRSHQSIIPSPINPLELVGDYFHLRPMYLSCEPGGKDRDTRVEVVRVV